tara:strand:- start:6880 stop:9510 length:2631 start_codon:yes stop_codon:yes gene_type:complete
MKGVHNAVFLTYSLSLPWFERLILSRLRANGLRRVLVLADADQLSQHVETDYEALAGAGRSYLVQGVSDYLSFHPKVLLLTGPNVCQLYVGSGNLNRRGLSSNLEVFENWNYSAGQKETTSAFSEVLGFIREIVTRGELERGAIGEEIRELLNGAAAQIPSVRKVDSATARIFRSPGKLWDALAPSLSNANEELRVVSPYFDKNGRMAARLAETIRPSTFQVITDLRTTNMTTKALSAIEDAGGEVVLLDQDMEDRLHAKILVGRGKKTVAITGSANCSDAAWLGRNCELVSLREGSTADVVYDLVDKLNTRPLTADDRMILKNREQLEDEEETHDQELPWLVSARWRSGGEIELYLKLRGALPSHVRVFGKQEREIAVIMPNLPIHGDVMIAVNASDLRRLGVTIVQLMARGHYGNAAIVMDLPEVKEHATGHVPAEELLRRLLGEDGGHKGAEELFELLARIAATEKPSKGVGSGGSTSSSQKTKTKFLVSDQDYESSGDASAHESPSRSSSSQGPIGARLISSLLFGDAGDDAEADASEGESEAGDDDLLGGVSSEGTAARRHNSDGAPTASLLQAADRARRAYVSTFQRTIQGRDAWRLNRDLQVLLASLHYLAKNGMTPNQFAGHVIPLLRAFLGQPSAPLPRALSALEGEAREEAWTRYPFLLNSCLFVYNATLAFVEQRSGPREELTDDFVSTKPVLWIRNIVKHTPPEVVHELLDTLEAQTSALHRGAFWVAGSLPRAGDVIGFPSFVRRVIRDAVDLNTASENLSEAVRSAQKTCSIEGSEVVVGLGTSGDLIAGFAETIGRKPREKWVGIMYQESFVAGEASALEARMLHKDGSQLVPLEFLEPLAVAAGEETQRGLEVLRRIANT